MNVGLIVRVLGNETAYRFDPFLMLDAFDSHNPDNYIKGFPMHPHRGIETLTYLIKGRIDHEDSLGNKGTISNGESQWMTGGSGILHQEMPQPTEHLLGLQLWINLPKNEKMTEPKYFDITKEMIPEVHEEQLTIRVIAGKYKEYEGVTGHHIATRMLDIEMKPDSEFLLKTDPKATVFVYTVEGEGYFDDDKKAAIIPNKVAVLFDKNEEFYAKAGNDGMRFIFFEARPLGDPIAWGGPIVMNTREEVLEAFDELSHDTFIKNND
ncbi:MAG: pirin family protein [Lentimicrobiaceae bacterium]|jgi:redox-sensitive bicupin YhaK (pirin superfamily)|nr:pirin family protein [Lentimicrobiaceae bacterium]